MSEKMSRNQTQSFWQNTQVFQRWEKKGLVSFGSKDQDTFDLDHENERGEGLDVKLSSLSAELQLEREREE